MRSELAPGAVRVARARAWLDQKAGNGPVVGDVEVVAMLGTTDVRVLDYLLLSDRAALEVAWDDLQDALVGGSAVPVTPGGTKGNRRLASLQAWVDQARDRGVDLTGVTDDEVERLASLAPRTMREFKQFGGGVRRHAKELLEVIAVSNADVADEQAPAPAQEATAAASDPHAVATASETTAVPSSSAERGEVSMDGFVPWVYPNTPAAVEPRRLDFHATGAESVRLSWPAPPPDGLTRIFRVSTSPSYVPDAAPELGTVICATLDLEAVDTQPFTASLRHVAVWVHEGVDERSARAAQPTLWAVGSCVLPVTRFAMREDEGAVIGEWVAPEGLARIDVLRINTADAAMHQHYDASLRLSPASVSSQGFIDRDALPGMIYEYRVYAIAPTDGVADDQLSPPVTDQIQLSAVLEAVQDLAVQPNATVTNAFDLSWTNPRLGAVEIYRTEEPPEPGIDKQVVSRSVLERNNSVLTPTNRLGWHRATEDARVVMREVPWPAGWSRAYFTPVTVVNEDSIQVGRTERLVRAREVSRLQLVERVDEQFITLVWPDGVSTVKVFVLPSGGRLVDPDSQTPVEECSRDDYRRFGGIHLRHPLPADGCSVHVVGAAYSAGRPVMSTPVSVEYRGLARIRYRIVSTTEKGMFGRARQGASRIVASADVEASNLPLLLVINPDRLPLHAGDGQELHRKVMSFSPGVEHPFLEQFDTSDLTGFVRLFADVPFESESRLAVLDPAVDTLRCP